MTMQSERENGFKKECKNCLLGPTGICAAKEQMVEADYEPVMSLVAGELKDSDLGADMLTVTECKFWALSQDVDSSMISRIGYNYDGESGAYVEFKGNKKIWRYPEVTREEFTDFETADSVGKHFIHVLKKKHGGSGIMVRDKVKA